MARLAVLALLLFGLLSTLVSGQGEDFDLSDALGDTVKKPTAPPKTPSADDDLNLGDALDGGGQSYPSTARPPKPGPNPNPKHPGSSGGFSDSDLLDGTSGGAGGGGGGGGGHGGGGGGGRDNIGGGGGNQRNDEEGQTESQGVIPGIIAAVVAAVAGAVSSFIAYQKKKLCFKENADQGDIHMENHRSTNAEPPVQQTLIEK